MSVENLIKKTNSEDEDVENVINSEDDSVDILINSEDGGKKYTLLFRNIF